MGLLETIGSVFSNIPIIGDALNFGANHYENVRNQHFQSDEANKQREWTSNENQLARQWQEDMYNQYNTPSAMMRQYKEADLNPFLMANQQQLGQGMSSNPAMAGSGAHATGSLPAPAPDVGSHMLQAHGVAAQASNQRANAQKQKWETAAMIFDKIGKGAYYKYIQSNPDMFLGDPESALAARETKARIALLEQDQANREFELVLSKQFKPDQLKQALQHGEYVISEAVARLNTMRINNEATIKRLANETVVALAQAFNLQKEGEYYQASAETANALRRYVVDTAKSQSLLLGNELYYSDVYKENFEGAAGFLTSSEAKGMRQTQAQFDLDERSDAQHRFIQMVLQDLGNVVHVGYGDYNSVYSGRSYNTSYGVINSQNKNYNAIYNFKK